MHTLTIISATPVATPTITVLTAAVTGTKAIALKTTAQQ